MEWNLGWIFAGDGADRIGPESGGFEFESLERAFRRGGEKPLRKQKISEKS